MEKKRLSVDLGFANLIAQVDDFQYGNGISVFLEDKDGNFIQDITCVLPTDPRDEADSVQCLMWEFENEEDWSISRIIKMYKGD